jgi:methylmalonyl-CoA mutase
VAENSLANLAHAIQITADFPDFYALTVNSHHFHEAGASTVQELAFLIAVFIEYADQLTERGVAVADIFNSTEFSVSINSNYFMEMAKCRALRVLIAKLAEAYQVSSTQVSIHAQTASWNKSTKDAYNTMIRTTIEAMAAVLGGCNAITVLPLDESNEDNLARRIGRNVSAILKEESYLNKVTDMAAGSYYIENLTYMLARQAWTLFLAVEAKGGFTKAYQSGFIPEEISRVRVQREAALQNGNQVIIGMNKYVIAEENNLGREYFRKLPGL